MGPCLDLGVVLLAIDLEPCVLITSDVPAPGRLLDHANAQVGLPLDRADRLQQDVFFDGSKVFFEFVHISQMYIINEQSNKLSVWRST